MMAPTASEHPTSGTSAQEDQEMEQASTNKTTSGHGRGSTSQSKALDGASKAPSSRIT